MFERVHKVPEDTRGVSELRNYVELSLEELHSLILLSQSNPSIAPGPIDNPVAGSTYYDATADILYVYNSVDEEWKAH